MLAFKAPYFQDICSCKILTYMSLESVTAPLAASSLALKLTTMGLNVCIYVHTYLCLYVCIYVYVHVCL